VPQFELATADVYRHWDRMRGPVGEEAPTRSLPGALRYGMPIRNDLTPAAIDLEPALGDFLADLRDRWETAALMTGSGSACFGFFPDLDEAVDAARAAPDDARLAVGVALRRNGVAEVET
jgi:4-diphosphocytidyl-2C-methyl-D-erythritol kinase